jgi:3-oxoadipate enol-lactonase
MPKIKSNIEINYEQQGSGEPLILIPYLSAEHACYAFQVPEFAKHFTCISFDPRGTGESEDPGTPYTIATLADDVAEFMRALGIERAHIFGMSMGAATGLRLAAKYPEKVISLSLHSPWTKSDDFIRTTVKSWQVLAKALNSVAEMVVLGIFPWCLTPELYASKPDYVKGLADFVRSRPAQSVQSFLRQSNAVMEHDVSGVLNRITVPTQVTFGKYDMVTSTRFAQPLKAEIPHSEVFVFENSAHAALYEETEKFNEKTLEFLQRRRLAKAV